MRFTLAFIAIMLLGFIAFADDVVSLNESKYIYAHISDPTTGAGTNAANGTVLFNVFANGSSTAFATGAMTQRGGGAGTLLGAYVGSFTASSGSVSVGDNLEVVGIGTVGSVANSAMLWRGRVIPAETVAGYRPTDAARINGGTVAISSAGTFNIGSYSLTSPTAISLGSGTLTGLLTIGGNTFQLSSAFTSGTFTSNGTQVFLNTSTGSALFLRIDGNNIGRTYQVGGQN